MLIELTVYLTAWGFARSFQNKGFTVFAGQCLLPVLVYTYFNWKLETASLYSWFTMPLIFLITPFEGVYTYPVVIAASVYLALDRPEFIKRIYFGIIATVALFVLKNQHLLSEIDGSDSQLPFFYLALVIVACPVIIYKCISRFSVSKTEIKV